MRLFDRSGLTPAEREVRRLQLAEYRKRMQAVSPEEWQSRLLALPPPLRNRVASIVVWDYLGSMLTGEFRRLAPAVVTMVEDDKVVGVTPTQLERGLLAVGYDEEHARVRAMSEETDTDESVEEDYED